MVWKVLAYTRVVAKGGTVRFFVANNAEDCFGRNVTFPVLGFKCSRNFCRKSMPRIFSLDLSAIWTVCVHFLFFTKMSVLNSFCLSFFVLPNAASKALMFIQVTADPVSIFQWKFFPFTVPLTAVFLLSPLKSVMFSKSLLQVAIDTVHKLKINWWMMLGAWMRGVIQVFTENPGIAG